MKYYVEMEMIAKAYIEVKANSDVEALKQAESLVKLGEVDVKWRTGEPYAKNIDRVGR